MIKNKDTIQVIDRMMSLFDLLAQHSALTLKQLTLDSGLATSTVHRILTTLKQSNWVIQDEQNRYCVGPRLAELASVAADLPDIRTLLKPVMINMSKTIQETVNLSVREGNELVYIERILPTRMLRVDVNIGKRTPLHVTAVGKLILGAMDDSEYAAYVKQAEFTAYTDNTITCAKQLRTHCQQALAKGVAIENEEAELGLGCYAVLFEHQQVSYGLSISAPVERMKQDWQALLMTSRDKFA